MAGQLMNADKGGRRAVNIALEENAPSPMHTVYSSASSEHFKEPLRRHLAEDHSIQDSRQERQGRGYVHFRTEHHVPDVGGLGWRTRAGHLLKNQAYYSSKPKTNKWDLPVHAGINTWKDWHGPKMRTDADMMERMDHYEEEVDQREAKKTWVNTVRAQTLDRFYNSKLNRDQLEASQCWAPHRRARREVHDSHENFFADMDAKPEQVLRHVFNEQVLTADRAAIRHIAKRIQNEETWKVAWRHMEQERRQDIRHDFKLRQNYNSLLMQLSGQPTRSTDSLSTSSEMRHNNCSQRTDEIALPHEPLAPCCVPDITSLTDFRGLIHADCEHALEALYPGAGHELSVEFRQRATASAKAGFPPPPRPETPQMPAKGQCRETLLQKEAALTTEKSPISGDRLSGVATRHHDHTLKRHSKAQFLATQAPPAPEQVKQLLNEDFSPKTTMQDPHRVTGGFERTDHCYLHHGPYEPSTPNRKGMETLPPGIRSFVYPVLATASPSAKGAQASGQPSEMGSSPAPSPMASFQASSTQPNFFRRSSMSSSGGTRRTKGSVQAPSIAVCKELDAFEASAESLPRISNFFGTPRSHNKKAQSSGSTFSGGLGKSLSAPSLNAEPNLQPA